MDIKTYKTGEFARLANVTERTIRYYDKIGLLKPSFVMENGYRQYSDADLLKLQKILSLKHLGFSIDEIFPMVMDDSDENFKLSLEIQSKLVDQKIKHLQSLKDSIRFMIRSIDNNSLKWNKVVELIRLTNMENSVVERYKTTNHLNIRINLHTRFSVNKEGWFPWLFRHISFDGVNRLLEIGCGNGKLWENTNLDLRNREIFLSDISEGMVSEVRSKMGSDFNCIVVDCENIPFKDAYFDALVANHVLFYVKDIENGLYEISRVLKDSGTFYCTCYGDGHMKEVNEIVKAFDDRVNLSEEKLYDRFGLNNAKEMLEKHFDVIIKIEYSDKLLVDEAQPLVEYIMSCHGNQNEIIGPRLNEFKEYIQSLIDRNGVIEISKNAGLFICKNER